MIMRFWYFFISYCLEFSFAVALLQLNLVNGEKCFSVQQKLVQIIPGFSIATKKKLAGEQIIKDNSLSCY